MCVCVFREQGIHNLLMQNFVATTATQSLTCVAVAPL